MIRHIRRTDDDGNATVETVPDRRPLPIRSPTKMCAVLASMVADADPPTVGRGLTIGEWPDLVSVAKEAARRVAAGRVASMFFRINTSAQIVPTIIISKTDDNWLASVIYAVNTRTVVPVSPPMVSSDLVIDALARASINFADLARMLNLPRCVVHDELMSGQILLMSRHAGLLVGLNVGGELSWDMIANVLGLPATHPGRGTSGA